MRLEWMPPRTPRLERSRAWRSWGSSGYLLAAGRKGEQHVARHDQPETSAHWLERRGLYPFPCGDLHPPRLRPSARLMNAWAYEVSGVEIPRARSVGIR